MAHLISASGTRGNVARLREAAPLTHPKGFRFGARPRSEPAMPHLRLAKYRLKAAPPPPPSLVWDWAAVPWGMHLNDRLGTCVPAAAANRIELVTYRNGTPVTIADEDVLAVYELVCGYNPNDPLSDQGCDATAVEQYLQSNGIAGHRIDAFAEVQFADGFDLLKDAVGWFGAVNLSITFPAGFTFSGVWDAPAPGWTPGEGHEIELMGYDADYFYCLTWGFVQKVTAGFLAACLTLALAAVSQDMLNAHGKTFNGLDYQTLLDDLNGGNGIVPVTPPPAPVQWWATLPSLERVGVVVAAGAALALVSWLAGLL